MSDNFTECMNRFFDQLSSIRQRAKASQLNYTLYQGLLRELDQLEKDGIRAFTEHLQTARVRQDYIIVPQIEQTIAKWQKDTDDLLKFLKRKTPRGV
jgi:hypothetical protein